VRRAGPLRRARDATAEVLEAYSLADATTNSGVMSVIEAEAS